MGYQTCVTSTGEMFTSLRIMYLAHSTIAMDMGAAFMGKVLLFSKKLMIKFSSSRITNSGNSNPYLTVQPFFMAWHRLYMVNFALSLKR